MFQIAKEVYRAAGVRGFWAGYDAQVVRQCIYAPLRLGIYFQLSESIKQKQGGQNLSLFKKTQCTFIASAIGCFVSTPFDLILIRM